MKKVTLFIFTFIFSASGETNLKRRLVDVRRVVPRDQSSSVRLNDMDINDSFFGKSKLNFSFGPDFQRFDLENLRQKKNSYYTNEGVSLSAGYEFWFSSFLTLENKIFLNQYKLLRYDGVSITDGERKDIRFNTGPSLIIDNFYATYNFSRDRRTWMFEKDDESVTINPLKITGHNFKVGYRLYVYKPVAIDFFYQYGILNGVDEVRGEIAGVETQFGVHVFWNSQERTQYGVLLTETIAHYNWEDGSLRNKTFKILPYLSF